jgi:hypothetical protein
VIPGALIKLSLFDFLSQGRLLPSTLMETDPKSDADAHEKAELELPEQVDRFAETYRRIMAP